MKELTVQFNKMKKSNTVSSDFISMKIIDKLRQSILPLILRMINQINRTSIFPDCLKFSRIIPIRKSMKESQMEMNNYRPVNILSPLSKIVEKFWSKIILQHLIQNKMISPNHQGGFPNRHSVTSILTIHQKLSQNRMNKQHSAVVQLDQSGAFDLVSHDILKKKLLHIGIEKKDVETIMNYLSQRKQYVMINGNSSSNLLTGPVSVGQGSVLSGLLYGIYTFDIHI